jgi:hypothetical protein
MVRTPITEWVYQSNGEPRVRKNISINLVVCSYYSNTQTVVCSCTTITHISKHSAEGKVLMNSKSLVNELLYC